MSKILRVLVTFIGAFILLALVAIFGLVVFVNPNDLKPQISQAVNKYTGRQLQLAGNIEWSLFPWLGLQLNDAKLSNTSNFGDKPFAEIKKLDIQVRLLPLLHKQLEIGKLHVKDLTLYLIKNARGQTNWQQTTPLSAPPPSTSSDALSNNLKPLGFVVAGIDIQNGHIFFDDEQKNKHYEISQLQLKSANLSLDTSSPFSANFNFIASSPKLNAAVKLSTDITLNADGQNILFKKLNFDTVLKDPAYPTGKFPLSLQGDIALNLPYQTVASDKFTLAIDQNKFIGHIKGQHLLDNPTVSGALSTEQFKSGKFAIQQVQLPFQLKNKQLSLKPITGKLYQGNYQGDALINFTSETPRLITHNQLTQINTQSLFQEFIGKNQIQLAGLANINLNLNTLGSDKDVLIKNLQGQGQFSLDNGAIKGINLAYWVAMGKALLKHQPTPVANSSDTPFNKFTGSFIINKGILSNNDLIISSGRLTIQGKGIINFPQQQINYELHTQPVLADGSPDGIAIPIRITGGFNSIRVAPILDKLSIDIVKGKFKGKIQDELKKLDLKKLFQ